MSWFGVLALIQSLVNPACIGPIVFFVGLQICEESLNFMPARHYSAFIVGVFPCIYDWVTNISNRSPLSDFDETYDTNSSGADSWYGVLAWKRGSLLVSMVWVAMIVNVIDRQWITATIWSVVAAVFAVFGIIHVPEAGFKNMNSPTWEQCTADGCWEFGYQWMYVVAYCMMGGTFLILWFASKYDDTLGEPIDDESRHAFDDWFKDAYTFVDSEGNYRDSRDNSLLPDPHFKGGVTGTVHKTDKESEEAEQVEEDVEKEAPKEEE
jgi:hypothetical protein